MFSFHAYDIHIQVWVTRSVPNSPKCGSEFVPAHGSRISSVGRWLTDSNQLIYDNCNNSCGHTHPHPHPHPKLSVCLSCGQKNSDRAIKPRSQGFLDASLPLDCM